jgi:hypothetical protein
MFLAKIKLAALLFLLTGVLAVGGVLTYHPLSAAARQGAGEEESQAGLASTPAPARPKVPRELLEKRRDAARKVFNQRWQRFQDGRETLGDAQCAWSKRWLEAEMALSEKKAVRTAALKAHLERLWVVERLAVAKLRAGVVGPEAANAATYYRVEAEIWLFEATGKLLPPPPEAETIPTPPTYERVPPDR